MKKSAFILFAALLLGACGAPAGNNTPANNSTNTNKAAANTATAPAADTAAVEADIKKVVADYATSTAKNDIAAYDKTLADNFMFVGPDGAVVTKAERLASMKAGETTYQTLTYDDVNVRVNAEGNGAIVIAKATVKGKNMGTPIDASVRVTQVWAKTKDGWKLASLQATNIAAKADDKKAGAPTSGAKNANAPASNK